MRNFIKLWIVERHFLKLHRKRVSAFVQGDPVRLKQHLIGQMQILVKFGVLPTWENFTKYGNGWHYMSRYFTAKDVQIYQCEWRKLSGKSAAEHWNEWAKKD